MQWNEIKSEDVQPKSEHLIHRLPIVCFAVGAVCLLAAIIGFQSNLANFFVSFHVTWIYFVSIVMGAIFFVLIQHATRAGWSVAVRRLMENTGLLMPFLSVFFLVILLGSGVLFHEWLSLDSHHDKILDAKRWYLNFPFFTGRGIFYLVAFSVAAILFHRKSVKQDHTGNQEYTYSLQNLSYPFLIVLGFCVTFAAFDWIMSLSPHWYSTIFGIYFFASCYLAAIAFLVCAAFIIKDTKVFQSILRKDHFFDLGTLLFGQTCFWAYAFFAQYLLIWYANIPEETKFFEVRNHHQWFYVWITLIVAHFFVPFFLLISRRSKQSRQWILGMAIWILMMHFVDLYWLIVPNFSKNHIPFDWKDLLLFFGFWAVFLGVFCLVSKKYALVPVKDPRLPESLAYQTIS